MSGLYPTAKKLAKPVHVTYPCLETKNEMIVSPEERSRFSKALESINKKILSQNLVWTNFLSWEFSKALFKEPADNVWRRARFTKIQSQFAFSL